MAEKAARRLFDEYGVNPQDIDFVLLCTQSPDYRLPSTACILQHRLGIPTTAGALDYNLACSGCIYGLAMAKGLIAAGIARNVLLLTAETYNKYIHPSDKSNRAIFGDGAAACLVGNASKRCIQDNAAKLGSFTHYSAEIGQFALGTDGSGYDNLIVKTGGSRHPNPTGLITKDEEDHVWRDDNLYMNGSAIFNFTLDAVPAMMERVLQSNGLTKDQIDLYVFHQANKFMLDTLRQVCLLPKDKFYIDLSTTGNTVSSSVLIALRDCLDRQLIGPGSTVMVAGFGTGLSLGGTILRYGLN
jgi:3-oxoacyl-[acyl-carrier-protein] synthase-3